MRLLLLELRVRPSGIACCLLVPAAMIHRCTLAYLLQACLVQKDGCLLCVTVDHAWASIVAV